MVPIEMVFGAQVSLVRTSGSAVINACKYTKHISMYKVSSFFVEYCRIGDYAMVVSVRSWGAGGKAPAWFSKH